jgi:hypothetical protein
VKVSERARVLKVGGILLALVVGGLIVGFLVLRGDDGSPPVSSSETNDPTPTPTDVRAQVEQAYLHAWDVWAEGLRELDPSRLSEVLTGRALEVVEERLEEQQEKNQPVLLRAEHNYRIVIIDEVTASVDDQYVNHSVRLDPDTLEPIEEDPNQRLHTSFTLKLVDGTWKIAEIIEYDDSSS